MKNNGLVFGLILLFASVFQGCVTQSKCERKFPPQTHDSIVYKDTTIYKRDTVYVPAFEFGFDTIGVIPDNITFKHTEKKKNLTASVSIHKGKLTVTCKEDSLRAIIETKDRIISTYKGNTEVRPVKEFIEYWWAKPCLYWFIGSLVFLILWLGYNYLSAWVSSIFKR